MSKSKLIVFSLLLFFGSVSLAFALDQVVLDDGNIIDQNADPVNWTTVCDTAGSCSFYHHSLFNVDTNAFLCNADGATGDLVGSCGSWTASTTGAYSLVLTYNGDTAQCRIGSGGYTGCVSATFVDEFLFDIVGESTSTPTSTTATSTPMEGYIAVLITVLFFCFGFWLSYNYMK